MTDKNTETEEFIVGGQVKWFDPTKGFGFILSEDGGPDILLHANVLRNYGQSSVADGAEISVKAVRTGRGLQALEVLSVDQPDMPQPLGLPDFAHVTPEEIANTAVAPARVKWFDKAKGFGFANMFGNSADVFVHIEVLRQAGLADLLPGEAIALRAIEGKRGLMAAEVLPWENATSQN